MPFPPALSHYMCVLAAACNHKHREMTKSTYLQKTAHAAHSLCRGTTLPQLLDEHKYFAGLSVFWVMMGSMNRTTRPETGGVLDVYTRCGQAGRDVTKVIANMFFAQESFGNPHNLVHRCASCDLAAPRQPALWGGGIDLCIER